MPPDDPKPPAEGEVTEATPAAAAEPAAAEPSAPPDPVQLAEERVKKLEAEKKDAHDRMLRVAADFENYKRRARKDAEEAEARGRKNVVTAVLPIVDNLERALEASAGSEGAASAIAEGVRLVMKQFLGTLDKLDVKPFVAVGAAFDPSMHEAIQQIETADAPAGTVVKELQKGYTFAGKLLRPAMVAVAKAPPAPAPPDEAKGDEPAVEVEAPVTEGSGDAKPPEGT